MHQHKAQWKKAKYIGWMCCVTPDACAARPMRQSAHGNVIRVDTCSCGATRHAEINQRHANYGPWESVDVCIAGNPAVNGICGDKDCVCWPSGPQGN
jgi:hypothetical protein